MGLKIFLLTIIWCLYICEAKRNFMRGRSRNGNLGDPILSKAYELPQEQWLHQKLDHSDPSDGRKWKQRYFVNDTFYQKNGPVFLMIGGEGEASPKWMVEGQWIEYAKQFGALCFQLEHRFYGKSHPTSDLSIKNLRFLTAEQALTDLAYFIEHMNELYKIPSGTKWIAFGGSYPGSLAAWMRVKYPNLIYGAVSSSGPLLAKIDFQEYYVVVEEALRQHSQACVNAVANASTQIDIMLKHPIGKIGLNKMFRLCDAIDPGSPKVVDIANLYETFASNLAGIVQYNKDNRNNSHMANFTVDTLCEVLVDQERGTALDRFADISNAILNATNEKCLDYNYEKMIRKLKDVDWKSEEAEGGRQWMYQTCTEFGFFQTSTARPTLFSKTFPVEFFIKQCEDVFGPRYNLEFLEEGVERTNIEYGALDIQVANVVFVHGSIDPWHTLGITKTSKPHTMAIYINGTAHCANMYPPSENDLPQLKEARQKVGELLEQWLKH